MRSGYAAAEYQNLIRAEPQVTPPPKGRCQSKILNTWSGHRTAQIDPEKWKKINGRKIRF
jgi:hypothetical protein